MMIVNVFEIICKRYAKKGAHPPAMPQAGAVRFNYFLASAMSLEVSPCILKLNA